MNLPLLDTAITLFALLGDIFLGLFTFLKNPKSATSKCFFFFAFFLGTYLFINNLALHQSNDTETLIFIRIVMFTAIIVNYAFYLLSVTFPFSKSPIKPLYFWISSIITVAILPLTLSPLVFSAVTPNTTQPIPGPGMALFLLHTIIFLGAGVVSLARKFRQSTGIVKIQTRLFLYGAASMFTLILTTNLLFVIILKTTLLVNLLPLYTLLFIGFISYAIVKHRFLDIGLVLARTVTYVLVVIIISFFYSASIFIVGQSVLGIHLSISQQIALLILTLLTAVSYRPIEQVIQKLTDRFLFKGNYDTNQVLNSLSHIMASTLKLENLTHLLLQTLLESLRISRGAFILLSSDQIIDVLSEGFDSPPTLDEAYIKVISNTRNTLIIDNLEENELKNILREMGISILVHLRTEGKQIGLLALGPKESGDIYSGQDLILLEILAPQAAIAIENSQAYEEIRRFNITLQDEVNKATSELKDANIKLEELDKLKDEFISVTSHELRAPMTAIKSYTWLVLNDKAGPIDSKARGHLDKVYQSTERLIHLVSEMLDVSRIESGRVQLKPEIFSVKKLADDVLSDFTARAAEMDLTLENRISDENLTVSADREKIHQVLENLVSNAIKFTPAKGTIHISAQNNNGFLETTVTDTGAGISPEDQKKLFVKFGRLENSLIARSGTGSGLGLYICKQYVELHKGKIWFTSEVGKGSAFTFNLPIA